MAGIGSQRQAARRLVAGHRARQRRGACVPPRQPMVARLRRPAAQCADRPGRGRQPQPAGRASPPRARAGLRRRRRGRPTSRRSTPSSTWTRQKFSEQLHLPRAAGRLDRRTSACCSSARAGRSTSSARTAPRSTRALGTANAAAADADAARVLLASNVARGWVQWARLNDRLAVAQRALAQREELLRLVRDRGRPGSTRACELKQSESSVPEARQQIEAPQRTDRDRSSTRSTRWWPSPRAHPGA